MKTDPALRPLPGMAHDPHRTTVITVDTTVASERRKAIELEKGGKACGDCHEIVTVRRDEFCPFDDGEIDARTLQCTMCATLFVPAGFWRTVFTGRSLRVAD